MGEPQKREAIMKAWLKKERWIKGAKGDEGSFPMLAAIMMVLLIFAGLAFLKWGADENFEAMRAERKLQAYYVAHAGLTNWGFSYLLNMNPSTIPPQRRWLKMDGPVMDRYGAIVGRVDVWTEPNSINEGGTGFADFNYVDVGAVGKVDIVTNDGEDYSIRDSILVTVKLLNLSQFLYLTNHETTIFHEVIKFWGADTLDGWVHSNDTISMMGGGGGPGPVFYNHVSTTAPFINVISGNPQYLGGPPWLNYREIQLPSMAMEVRNAASSMGLFFTDDGQFQDDRASRLIFNGDQGWRLYQWPIGNPWDPNEAEQVGAGGPPNWAAIFVDGYLEIEGIVKGQVTVGAKGNPVGVGKNCIRLVNDVRYWMSDSISGRFNDSTGNYLDILGLVSESDIVVANTYANGKDNGKFVTPTGMWRHSILINGALVALGESFTFEDQNDNYYWEYSSGTLGPYQDERGDIRMVGSVTQFRRGYVHRNNHGAPGGGPAGGTGYGKQYHYDKRFDFMAPPYFIQIADEEGNAQFEIVSWGHWENKTP